jgi:hypothetical protein
VTAQIHTVLEPLLPSQDRRYRLEAVFVPEDVGELHSSKRWHQRLEPGRHAGIGAFARQHAHQLGVFEDTLSGHDGLRLLQA